MLLAAAGLAAQPAAAAADLPAPALPSTSPSTACQGGTLLGDTSVTFSARIDGPGAGVLDAEFRITTADHDETVVAGTGPGRLSVPVGQEARYPVPRDVLFAAADGRITTFAWKVRTVYGGRHSTWSTCRFAFDPTRQGAPVVTAPTGAVIGRPVTVAVAPPADGTVPAGYRYQLNSDPWVDVPADTAGRASFTFTAPREVDTLTVTSLSPGGNQGGSTALSFAAAAPPPNLTTGDLDGDGKPDLVTVGGRAGLASGIWAAPGRGDGHLGAARNIGVNGPGFKTDPTPGDFDGALALTGRFTGGSFQDVLVYWPSGPRAGLALVLSGDGSGGPLPGGGVHGHLTDWSGGNAPTQVVEGGNVSGRGTGLADLLGIAPNGSGGTSLTLYASGWAPGAYGMPRPLTAPTPDGDRNWNDWTIASTELPAAGGGTSTALYLWKKSTGELTLWKDLAADPGTGTLTYRAFPVATGWNTGADLTLQAADIDSDGTPDLWTLDGAGHVTADLVTGLGTGAPATVTEVAGTLAG
ncbi:FG-GAP repeat domain-containing protein [Kitasatospora cineracea]|uniref:FG-GAP repeat domain-containing protein n=1 Tax=Kitasatospora cineracea TaxID=88074 RepID=UPI0033C741F5